MRPTPLLAALLFAAAPLFASGAADDTGSALLWKIDSANRVGDHFACEMRVESFKHGKLKEQNQIVGFTSVDAKLDIRSLVHFIAPKSVAGRKMLIEDHYIWALFPKTRNLIRLTPLQILLGEVAYGDILRIVYGKDYDLRQVRDTVLEGTAARALMLELKQDRKGANYPSILLTVAADGYRILQADIYGSSGKHIKTARFGDPAPFRGLSINRKVEIRDALKPERHSILQYLRMGEAQVPPAYFSKDLLARARIYDF